MKRLFTSFMAFALSASLFTCSASYATATGTVVHLSQETINQVLKEAATEKTAGFCAATYATAMQGVHAVREGFCFARDLISLGVKYPVKFGALIVFPYALHEWYLYLTGTTQKVMSNRGQVEIQPSLPWKSTIVAGILCWGSCNNSYQFFSK